MNIDLIEQNKDFVAKEAIAYMSSAYPAYEFDKEFLRRDAHMIMDIVAGELHIDGAMHPALNATPDLCENFWQLNKFKKSFRVFRKQNPATLDTLQFIGVTIKQLLKDKITEEQELQLDTVMSLIAVNASAGSVRTPQIEFLEEYFEKGFVVTKTPEAIQERLWEEIRNTNWVPGAGQNTYKTIPDWYVQKKRRYIDPTGADRQVVERWEGLYGYYHAPESLKKTADMLINDPFFEPLRLYRPPNAIAKFIHFWNGSENTQHHVDSIDGSDVMIFCYCTEAEDWQEDWGGYINLMKEVNGEFYYTRNVMPNNGVMVVVNNSAPIFKHGIRDLINKQVNRYTFIFHYTWEYDKNEKFE